MSQIQDQTDETLQLTPTVIIGLGGTGKEVLLRIRRMFYERKRRNVNGSIGYPIIGYLMVDTDDKTHEIDGEPLTPFLAEHIGLSANSPIPEFVHAQVGEKSFNDYFNFPNLYPHISRWLLPETDRHGFAAIVNGAGQNRPFGRLAFFHNYRRDEWGIRRVLTERIKEVINKATNEAEVQKWKTPEVTLQPDRLEIVIVYSLSGGTGAGMFLDMGMLAREVVQGLTKVTAHITHIAVLPEVFVNKSSSGPPKILDPLMQRKVQENAFAALREMEYFALKRGVSFDMTVPPATAPGRGGLGQRTLYTVEWVEGEPVHVTDAPWDTCYLVGSSNDTMGEAHLSEREVYQLISEFLFLDFDPSDFGQKKRSLRSNLTEVTLNTHWDVVRDVNRAKAPVLYRRPLSRRFSIFGLSQIYFDRVLMRRAASHRLARRLVAEYWFRDPAVLPSDLTRLAGDDLIGLGNNRTKAGTPTHLAGDNGRSVAWESVRDRIMLMESDGTKTWLNQISEEVERLRKEIEKGTCDYASGRPITDLIDRHVTRITGRTAATGEPGLVLRNFEAQQTILDAELESRLGCLFRHRVGEHGIRGALALFKEYAEIAERQIVQATGLGRQEPKHPDPQWPSRLEEARGLPVGSFARRATRQEALRAAKHTRDYLGGRFVHAAAPYIKDTLSRVSAQVSDRPADAQAGGSYARLLRWFNEAAEAERGLLKYLGRRFEESTRTATGQTRTIGLFEQLDEAGYDQLVLATPEISRLNRGAGRSGGMNWAGIEQVVIERLRQCRSGLWKDVTDLGGLVLKLCPLRSTSAPTVNRIQDLARDLAEACESLLEGFAADKTALGRFRQEREEESESCLRRLRSYSSPYLRFANTNQTVDANSTLRVLLGISDSDAAVDLEAFSEQVKNPRGGGPNLGNLGNLQSFSMKEDAITLYQEKAGIPLCYYQGLVPLARLYKGSKRIKETHIDYETLYRVLPEICLADPAHERDLAESLQATLYGIITRRIRFKDGDYIINRDHGAGRMPTPVGGDFATVANYLAFGDEANQADRQRLESGNNAWFEQASQGNGGRLIALWCALQWMHEEIRQRVEVLVGHKLAPREEHPLLRLLAFHMLPYVHGRLATIPGAQAHLNSGLDWSRTASDDEISRESYAFHWAEWKRAVAPCFETFVEEVIPVLRQASDHVAAALPFAAPAVRPHPADHRDGVPPAGGNGSGAASPVGPDPSRSGHFDDDDDL